MKDPIKRFAVVQESGFQLYFGRYENNISELIPCNDEEFGKQWVALKNRKTDLPFYLAEIEVKITGELKQYTDEKLVAENIEPLSPEPPETYSNYTDSLRSDLGEMTMCVLQEDLEGAKQIARRLKLTWDDGTPKVVLPCSES